MFCSFHKSPLLDSCHQCARCQSASSSATSSDPAAGFYADAPERTRKKEEAYKELILLKHSLLGPETPEEHYPLDRIFKLYEKCLLLEDDYGKPAEELFKGFWPLDGDYEQSPYTFIEVCGLWLIGSRESEYPCTGCKFYPKYFGTDDHIKDKAKFAKKRHGVEQPYQAKTTKKTPRANQVKQNRENTVEYGKQRAGTSKENSINLSFIGHEVDAESSFDLIWHTDELLKNLPK